MKRLSIGVILIFIITLIFIHEVYSEPLKGEFGKSSKWGSGWLDLSEKKNFKKGDKFKLEIGGKAKKIVVRLLPKGVDQNSSSGIDGGVVKVPKNRIVKIKLKENHRNVVQISVHGGSNPWGLFPLGEKNGSAILLSAERTD
ncbi:MAG: hypothetical protein KAQ85_09905 [Thermodesulfovibrionia bacterium]|nr:hypothetical protein [Thermodesulfovibrionia bacterium]